MAADLAIADDDTVLRACLTEYLRAHGLYVATVGDGAALRQALRARPADLVLFDLNMPGEDGLSVARALRGGEFGDPAMWRCPRLPSPPWSACGTKPWIWKRAA